MALADDFRAALVSGLGSYGQAATVRHRVPGAYDPLTGATAAETLQDTPGTAWIGGYHDQHVKGNVLAGDRKVTFIATNIAGFQPEPGDILSATGHNLTIVKIDTLQVSGVLIAHIFQARNVA